MTYQVAPFVGSYDDKCQSGEGLYQSRGIAIDPQGVLFVADERCHRIRRVELAAGTLSTFAGGDGNTSGGFVDDTAPQDARFDAPAAVSVHASSGDLYVADTGNHCIRTVSGAPKVSTFAGICQKNGYADGKSIGEAKFNGPNGIAVGSDGVVYVSDTLNHCIRRIAGGEVTTIAGVCKAAIPPQGELFRPNGIVVKSVSPVVLYVADSHHHRIVKIEKQP